MILGVAVSERRLGNYTLPNNSGRVEVNWQYYEGGNYSIYY